MTNEIITITDDEPVEPEHECFLTGDTFVESEMVQVCENTSSVYRQHRRQTWSRLNPERPEQDNPYTEPTMVWVWNALTTAYCGDCGELTDTDDNWNSELEVCGTCADNYNYCHEHEIHYADGDYCSYCDESYDNEDEYGSSLIHDYGYRPSPVFYVITKSGLSNQLYSEPIKTAVTGFELEMEATDCDIADAADACISGVGDIGYLKHDGSLSNGFELVTHPMTIEYVNSKFNFDVMRDLAKMGMRSAKTSSCGLHVHINKGYFSPRPTSLYRFISMFYANPEQWQRLAGRSRSSYAQWDLSEQGRLLHYAKMLKQRAGNYGDYNNDRYVAVNLQPSKTIEMRFFKGTLRPETLKARIQSIHAVAEYALATGFNINIKQSARWDEFRTWTESNSDKFAAFNTYANEKGV